MSEYTLIEDLSNKNLKEVPKTVLDLSNLKMLYLESNIIKTLPDEIFKSLNKLTWLDVRNNKLKTLPQTIINHPNLETILLQNNQVKLVPLELGFVPKLSVLQLSGNPVSYPEKSILDQGFQSIKKFLQNEYTKQKLNNTTSMELIEETNKNTEKKEELPIITLKSYHKFMYRHSRGTTRGAARPKEKRGHLTKKVNKNKSKCSIYSHKNTPYSNSNKCLSMMPYKKNEVRVQEHFMKDLWLKKLKEILLSQQEIIQRQNDQEVLKKWRQSCKQNITNTDPTYRPEVPYDYNPEYDQIPSRTELIRNRTERESKPIYPQSKPKVINIEKMITEIIDALKHMERERSIEKTPSEQMDYAGREINRILDLQKRISALRVHNDRML